MRPKIFYGWTVAAVVFCAFMISVGPRQSFSMFLLALLEEFGGSRSRIAGVFSVHIIFYGLSGWGLGVLVDRVGPRKVLIGSTMVWAATLLICSQVREFWQLYLVFGVVGGLADGGISYVPNNAVIARWFVRYRGLATGWVLAALPLGAALFAPVAQWGISRAGWRSTYALFGGLVITTSLPLLVGLLRNDPRELGLQPDGRPEGSAVSRKTATVDTARGFPTGYWRIFCANILRGMSMYALVVHVAPYLVDVGFSKMAAATAFSGTFLLATIGGLLAGALSDRIGRLPTYAGIAGLYVVGYCSLLATRPGHGWILGLCLVTAGLASGGAPPVFAALLTDRLQGPRLGHLLGLQNIGFSFGSMLGPFLAGLAFDWFGKYTLAFVCMAAAMVGSSVLASMTTQNRLSRA